MKKSKKIISLLLAISMILAMSISALAAVNGDDLQETNDDHSSYSTAMTIEDDNTYRCVLTSNYEEDWYKVTFNQGGKGNFWIHCTNPSDANLSLQVYVITSAGRLQSVGGPSYTGNQTNQQAYVTGIDVNANTTYYIKVSGSIGSTSADYTLRARRVTN